MKLIKIKKQFYFNSSAKEGKEKVSNTAEGEKTGAFCLFPSMILWNPEEGAKNPPKSWFKRKGEEKKRMTVQ